MAYNPSKRDDALRNPIERTNPLNEPDYAHEEGYNPFELTCPKVLTARYGEATPISCFETVPGDRHLMSEGIKTFLDQVDSRVMSEVNAYIDYFHVPLRNIFPINYEKIAVNPVKGDDVPFSALPQIPLLHTLYRYLDNPQALLVTVDGVDKPQDLPVSLMSNSRYANVAAETIAFSRLLYISFILSRGQLLDYIGFRLDDISSTPLPQSRYKRYKNVLQQKIDEFFDRVITVYDADGFVLRSKILSVYGIDLSEVDQVNGFNTNKLDLSETALNGSINKFVKLRYVPTYSVSPQGEETDYELSSFRAALYDCFERGLFPIVKYYDPDTSSWQFYVMDSFEDSLYTYFVTSFLKAYRLLPATTVEDYNEFFDAGFINPSRIVAYQQSIAEYMTNDRIDNVFSAELWMQNIRAIMYPSSTNLTIEPTFKYNGVDYEYDLFTTGGFRRAFFDSGNTTGLLHRMTPFLSNVFILRRSLRFGDYFATGRPNMLAVGDLSIPVDSQTVSPVDVTKGLMLQRFFNAVNRWGMRFVNYMASLFGVKPSDTGCQPAFITHRQITLSHDTVANTSNAQGKITTNLVGTSSSHMFDVFLDDFGILLGVVSYDTLAYYPSGVDRALRHGDRFSMFNPMLQNIGDQEIRLDELTGDVVSTAIAKKPFAYATRYNEYKKGLTSAHGGFVNYLPAMVFVYPYRQFIEDDFDAYSGNLRINPDFIRDMPFYLDAYVKSLTSLSPAQYFHFTLSVNNPHQSARKMEYWPGIL